MSWLIGAGIIAAVIFMIVRRGLQMKELAHNGVVTQGKIIMKSRREHTRGKQSSGYFKYEFMTPTGERFERQIVVSEEVFETYEEGSKIDVVYVEGKPSVNGARYMVNLSREALKLPPL